ncbi:MAG: hypothetical protein RL701_6211 [Pseudomonadota bacterium]
MPGRVAADDGERTPKESHESTVRDTRNVPARIDVAVQTSTPSSDDTIDYETARTELAGAPLIGGNSDIGFEFGAVLTATRFGEGAEPYAWNSDLVLAASVKNGPHGAEIAQQNYLMQLDMPRALPDRLRFTITGSFQRTLNYGYYGMDDSPPTRRIMAGRANQFDQREALLRTLSRIALVKSYQLVIAANLRFADPHAYADSQLSEDAAAGRVYGLRALGLASLGVGMAYDTRDNEFFPTRGVFHQFGVKGSYAVPLSAAVGYVSTGAALTGFFHLAGPVILAVRGLVDAQAGHVPFYDLALGGTFLVDELPGGPGGIRGVPIGRYRGLVKMLGNVELRARFWRFAVFGAKFRLGGDVFFDTGRSFQDYHFRTPAGRAALLWGTGAGLYLQWGQAALFRAEAAYSPDSAANGGFPLGVYVAQGTMF